MGTKVQSKMLLGHYPSRGLNTNGGTGSWPLHQEQKTLRGQYHNIFFQRPERNGHEGYQKEHLRQTILKHETIFRHQLHELHRLYKTQRDLMNDIRSNEPLLMPAETSQSNVFPAAYLSEDDKKRWHISTLSLMDCSDGKLSASAVDSIQSHFDSMKGKIMQSKLGSTQTGVMRKDNESLEPQCRKLQTRFLDLEIPPDEFINSEPEQQGVSGVSGMRSCPPNRTNEIACKRDRKLSICIGMSTGYNADAFSSNMHLRKTPRLTDLNVAIQVEEESASAIRRDNTFSKEGMKRQDSSASAYSSFQCLPKNFSQNPHNRGDGAVSSLRSEIETQNQDWPFYSCEAGKTKSKSSFCGNFLPQEFSKPCESSQVETPKAHSPATCFPSDQNKTEQQAKRTLFGVEISDINRDSSPVASHTLGLHSPQVPNSDAANSESGTISRGTKPPDSLSPQGISTQGNLCFNTSIQPDKSLMTLMQSPEALGELSKDNTRSIPYMRAVVSYQNDVYSVSNELRGCHPSVRPGFQSDISNPHFSFEQFQQHEPQKYLRGSGCIMDVKSAKEISTDAIALDNTFKVVCQQNLVSVDWPRNKENSQGAFSWQNPKPNVNCKYFNERGGTDHRNLSSWQNHSLQLVNRSEMRKGASLSYVQDSSSATHADNAESGKSDIGDCSGNRKIVGLPFVDKPHILKDLPSHGSPSNPSCLASTLDNSNAVKVGFILTDLAHDPLSLRPVVQCKFEDLVVEKGLVNGSAASRHQIDLNICMTEEEVLSRPSSPITIHIDLETPVVSETERGITSGEGSSKCKSGEPFDPFQEESRVPREGLIRVAAEALVSISSLDVRNLPGNDVDNLQGNGPCHQSEASLADSLRWLADIISSYEGYVENAFVEVSRGRDKSFTEEIIPDGIDYFEFMTLNLTESKVENYSYKPQTLGQPKDENTLPRRRRRGQTRRGRQRKDFQRDILPSLTSLSRNQVTADLQTIEGLIRTTGGSWQSGLAPRNSGKSGRGRGRRRAGVSYPSPTATSECPPLVQQPKCTELGFEEGNLTGWGKRTRRPSRQRFLINSPPLPSK